MTVVETDRFLKDARQNNDRIGTDQIGRIRGRLPTGGLI
jgi:hypothetical protein